MKQDVQTIRTGIRTAGACGSLLEDLRQDILSNRLSVGKPILPETELAAHYKISRNTVRRALDHLVQEGLLRKIKGVGSFVVPPEERSAHPDRKLAQRQILFLSFATASTEDVFRSDNSFLPKFNGINRVLLPHGYNLLFAYVGLDWTPPPCLINNDIGGIIFYGPLVPEFWKRYIAPRPHVGIQFIDPLLPGNWVKPDYESLGMLAVEHLHSLGHRRIAFVTNEMEMQYSEDRMTGYLQGLKRFGLPVREEYLIAWQREKVNGILQGEDISSTQDYIPYLERAFQGKAEPPSAFICMDDWRAVCTIRALEKLGLRVPSDVSVIGTFNDYQSPYADLDCHITSFSCRMSDVCSEAAQCLLEQIAGSSRNCFRTISVRPEFFPGKTTAPPTRIWNKTETSKQ